MTEEKVVLKDQSETYLEVDEPVDVKETLTTQVVEKKSCSLLCSFYYERLNSSKDKLDKDETLSTIIFSLFILR